MLQGLLGFVWLDRLPGLIYTAITKGYMGNLRDTGNRASGDHRQIDTPCPCNYTGAVVCHYTSLLVIAALSILPPASCVLPSR
ncbi:hypothetical protein SDC9_211506 [bioreactor metagenome]|uniref:Uncharacterized protein n=1 Tax=bioreactor metagenome TaxID=1076179 RepID=A0A645JKV7_9ZZZZ